MDAEDLTGNQAAEPTAAGEAEDVGSRAGHSLQPSGYQPVEDSNQTPGAEAATMAGPAVRRRPGPTTGGE